MSQDRLTTALLFMAIAATAALMPAQSDTFWHLRAGQLLWSSGQVPLVDTFSHTAAGREWPNHEWLWQAISFPVFRLGGFPLLTLLATALAAAGWRERYRDETWVILAADQP